MPGLTSSHLCPHPGLVLVMLCNIPETYWEIADVPHYTWPGKQSVRVRMVPCASSMKYTVDAG